MALEIKPATDKQIEQFLKAAAERYAQKGIPPEKAAVMFRDYMSKAGAALGFKLPEPKQIKKVAKVAKAKKGK